MENENNKIHIQSNSCSLRNVLCMIHVVLVFDKQNFVLTSFCHAVLCMIPVVLVLNKQFCIVIILPYFVWDIKMNCIRQFL